MMHSLIQFSRELVAGAGGAVWSACQGAENAGGAVWSACGSVGSTGPTVLPIRKEPLALAYDPLDNRKIAFGVVRFALRRFP